MNLPDHIKSASCLVGYRWYSIFHIFSVLSWYMQCDPIIKDVPCLFILKKSTGYQSLTRSIFMNNVDIFPLLSVRIIQSAAVLRIRRIRMFLGLLDPDPDPLVRGMDPDPSISPKQNSKKNLDSYCYVTSFWLFIFEKLCKCTVPSKRIKQKNFFKN